MKALVVFTCLTLFNNTESLSLVSWIWSKPVEENNKLVGDNLPLVSIPYESMTEDEKFLQEAAKVTHIQISSPLETCQHKVVMRIRTSCSEMTEEQLAKLSVNLLNCQSAAEGRKMFPCTDEMTLKQCTMEMDADMWNAYHLMSNRARAVCYAARSTQFRALTELTVNKLMNSARSQIEALNSLKERHEGLENSLSMISDGNKLLIEQQKDLKDVQSSTHNAISNNIRELYNEKALIRAGHVQLSIMTEDIKHRLENASQILMSQAKENEHHHKELLKDLMNIQRQAQLIWDKIESSTDRIVQQNAEAAAQYEQTLVKLEKINDTINFIWNVTELMRSEIDEKLGWITTYIGTTGEQLQKVYRVSLHIVYLLAAMIIAAFLNAPFLSRVTIMGLIPINLVTFLKHGINACLDFTSITFLIFLITGMHYLMNSIHYLLGNKLNKSVSDDKVNENYRLNHPTYTSTPARTIKKCQSITEQTKNSLTQFYYYIIQQMIQFKDKIKSVISFCQQNTSQVEELSCSYLPSRRAREDVVNNHNSFPNMSEDITDYTDTSMSTFIREDSELNDIDENIVDADTLRRRLYQNIRSKSTSRGAMSSRSTTPNSVTYPKILCGAITKNGTPCRFRAQQNKSFCSRHSQGSSVLGD